MTIQIQDVTPYQSLQIFINGLIKQIKHDVHLLKPFAIQKAMKYTLHI